MSPLNHILFLPKVCSYSLDFLKYSFFPLVSVPDALASLLFIGCTYNAIAVCLSVKDSQPSLEDYLWDTECLETRGAQEFTFISKLGWPIDKN